MKRALVTFGTRPEAIKLAPVVRELRRRPDEFAVEVCATAQHREMLDQVLEIFDIAPEYDLDLMRPNQTLAGLMANMVQKFDAVLEAAKPDLVVVQGDTATTFNCALTAFYRRIGVAHVEAGLRTDNRFSPFPEEINRRLTAPLTDWHFAPTERSRRALLREGYADRDVHVVGNTAIDALHFARDKVRAAPDLHEWNFPFLADGAPMVLVTGHRRESFGQGFENICHAIAALARRNPGFRFVYAAHLNPHVQEPVNRILAQIPNVHLIAPQDYLSFVWLMDRSYLLLTDSGGVQEEAPSLGKPVVVMRDVTERMEAVEVGVAVLVGADAARIEGTVQSLIDDRARYERMAQTRNPFGDGRSSVLIADILARADAAAMTSVA